MQTHESAGSEPVTFHPGDHSVSVGTLDRPCPRPPVSPPLILLLAVRRLCVLDFIVFIGVFYFWLPRSSHLDRLIYAGGREVTQALCKKLI